MRLGTIRGELSLLRAMTAWATVYRRNGRPLLLRNPLVGLTLPQEPNMRRPVATATRFERWFAVADAVEPTGRFRCVLLLARHTGRGIKAICELRAFDVLCTREQVEAGLAAAGLDLGNAAHWPHGVIRWSHQTDKRGYDAVAPLSRPARAALDAYLVRHPRIGDVPLFPRAKKPALPLTKHVAIEWLRRATVRAKLPPIEHDGYHTLRRLWASERRTLPVQDVAAAGGWRSIEVLQKVYQHAEAAMLQRVVDAEPDGLRDAGKEAGGPPLDPTSTQVMA